MKKSITLKKVGYLITGISDVTPWGGGNACIEMKPFRVDKLRKADILKGINDNGFGVEAVNGADCDVWELFEDNYKTYLENIIVGRISENTQNYYINNF